MTLHKRTLPCQKAANDLRGVLVDWLRKHPDLTWAEAVHCLAGMIASWTTYLIRDERHPNDPDKRADEA